MLPYRDSRIVRIGLLVFFLVVIGYAYYEGRALLKGPSIEVSPRVMAVTESFIDISGRAERITSLTLNGKQIPVTEEGVFTEGYVLAPGYNRLILRAEDRYGKSTEKTIEIMYTPQEGAGVSSPTLEESLPE